MDFINFLIDNYNIPLLSGFLLGLMSSISPCTLAANVGAIAYITKDIKTPKSILLNGLFYTPGRALSYGLLGLLIYFGVESFLLSNIFQGWGVLVIGPLFIMLGLIMLGLLKLRFRVGKKWLEIINEWLLKKGYIGSLLLGMILALAFCPYSGIIFFGVLIPIIFSSSEGYLLPIIFAFGTGLPVMIFAFVIAYSINKLGKIFNIIQKIEKNTRLMLGVLLILVGGYYCRYLIKYLIQFIIN